MTTTANVGDAVAWRGELWTVTGDRAERTGPLFVEVTNARGVSDLIPGDTFRFGGAVVVRKGAVPAQATTEVRFADPGDYCEKVYALGCWFAETPVRSVKRALKLSAPANGIDVAQLHAGSVSVLEGA